MNLPQEKMSEDSFGLFGHIHKLCMIKSYGINVGADCHNFTPIDLDTVLFYHNAALHYYDENVFN
jgi:calcineurin-like phosphoesterase family protein